MAEWEQRNMVLIIDHSLINDIWCFHHHQEAVNNARPDSAPLFSLICKLSKPQSPYICVVFEVFVKSFFLFTFFPFHSISFVCCEQVFANASTLNFTIRLFTTGNLSKIYSSGIWNISSGNLKIYSTGNLLKLYSSQIWNISSRSDGIRMAFRFIRSPM